jgi:hypothetical protein
LSVLTLIVILGSAIVAIVAAFAAVWSGYEAHATNDARFEIEEARKKKGARVGILMFEKNRAPAPVHSYSLSECCTPIRAKHSAPTLFNGRSNHVNF